MNLIDCETLWHFCLCVSIFVIIFHSSVSFMSLKIHIWGKRNVRYFNIYWWEIHQDCNSLSTLECLNTDGHTHCHSDEKSCNLTKFPYFQFIKVVVFYQSQKRSDGYPYYHLLVLCYLRSEFWQASLEMVNFLRVGGVQRRPTRLHLRRYFVNVRVHSLWKVCFILDMTSPPTLTLSSFFQLQHPRGLLNVAGVQSGLVTFFLQSSALRTPQHFIWWNF